MPSSAELIIKDAPVKELSPTRMFYIDNMRLLFTVLVILHHVALTYGAHSGWYYYENTDDAFTNLVLTLLMTLNRTWVLGCFFMITGYFTPGSYDRKGIFGFLKDRLIRLGIPLAIFAFLVRPSIVYLMNRGAFAAEYSFWENILFLKNVAPGPAWFLEVLLAFSVVYGLWRCGRKPSGALKKKGASFPKDRAIMLFILMLAAATFVIRVYFPTEKQIFRLRIGNYAVYIAFFAAGIMAYRNRWLEGITEAIGRRWTAITAAAALIYCIIVYVAWSSQADLSFLRGGTSVKTLLATYVETVIAIGSTISLSYIFRRFFNKQPVVVKGMADDAYAVFIFHAPVIVAYAYFTRNMLSGYPFLKFITAFIAGSALCFLVCHYVVRKLPFAQRVL
ncbi:MAG TPA: acyltransferase family protein [Syntrophorhabdaceae bacterium]|nr:acyltransferase family protein [Syntrophorhabdaceae bacterium]